MVRRFLVLPAAHAGMGCRSPGNLSKMQIKAGMEGCSLRVHSSVVVKLHRRDGWGSAPRVPHTCAPPGQHGIPWRLCFLHTHPLMPPVSTSQSPFCLMNPCLSPPALVDLCNGPATEDEMNSVPHPSPDGPSVRERPFVAQVCLVFLDLTRRPLSYISIRAVSPVLTGPGSPLLPGHILPSLQGPFGVPPQW